MEKGEKGKGISYIARKNIDNNVFININIKLNNKHILCEYIKMGYYRECEAG